MKKLTPPPAAEKPIDKSFKPLDKAFKPLGDASVAQKADDLGAKAIVAGATAIAEAPGAELDDDFAPAPPATLGVGAAGPEVASLQERLVSAGFDPGPIDGQFGPLTQAAVASFQEAAGLATDGVAGPETFGVLAEVEAQLAAEAAAAGAPPEAPEAPETPAEIPAEGVPTGASTTVPAEGETPAPSALQEKLLALPNPTTNPQSFLAGVNKAASDFQNGISNNTDPKEPAEAAAELQLLAGAFAAAGPAGQAQAQVFASLATLAGQPGMKPAFQQEIIRAFTNDGGNVGNLQKAMQAARDLEDPLMAEAAFNTVAAAAQAAAGVSPAKDQEKLAQLGTLAASLADPKVSPEVRHFLGQASNGDNDVKDFKEAIEASNSAEDYTAILAYQLTNAKKLEDAIGLPAAQQAQMLQFLANNFDALSENRIFNKMENVLKDPSKMVSFLNEAEAVASDSQKKLIEDFAKIVLPELG